MKRWWLILLVMLSSCIPPSVIGLRDQQTIRRIIVIDQSGDVIFSDRATYRYDGGRRMYVLTLQDGRVVHVSDAAVVMAYDEVTK